MQIRGMNFLVYGIVGSLLVAFSPFLVSQVLIQFKWWSRTELFVWVAGVGLFLMAVGFYALKVRLRMGYGIVELLFGFLIMASATDRYLVAYQKAALGSPYHNMQSEYDLLRWSITLVPGLQIGAAIYIVVRGLDNIGEGINSLSNKKWGERWRRLFPKGSEAIKKLSEIKSQRGAERDAKV